MTEPEALSRRSRFDGHRPVEGARVAADQREDARERDEWQGGKTDAEGRACVRGLVEGKAATVTVEKAVLGSDLDAADAS